MAGHPSGQVTYLGTMPPPWLAAPHCACPLLDWLPHGLAAPGLVAPRYAAPWGRIPWYYHQVGHSPPRAAPRLVAPNTPSGQATPQGRPPLPGLAAPPSCPPWAGPPM